MKKIITLLLSIYFACTISGCSAIEDANYIKDYKESVMNVRDSEPLEIALYNNLDVMDMKNKYGIDLENTEINEKQDYGMFEELISVSEISSAGNLEAVYIKIMLMDNLYKNQLNVILKESEKYIEEYQSKSNYLFVSAFSGEDGILEWYSAIDLSSNGKDEVIITGIDYVSYLKDVAFEKVDVETNDYFYNCKFKKSIYKIDILEKLDSELTLSDIQRKNISKLDSDVLNTINYFSYNYELRYDVYFKSDYKELTVHLYPRSKEKINKKEVSMYSLMDLINEITESSAKVYEKNTIVLFEDKDKNKVVYETVDGKIVINELK